MVTKAFFGPGTAPFTSKRLLENLEKAIDNNLINDEIIVQLGHTKYSSNKMKLLDFVSSEELNNLINSANLVITHGGVGSIIGSIKLNKKVIAVARLSKYKEHVNDHQIQIVKNFDEEGYIIGIDDACKLSLALNRINNFIPKKFESNSQKILNIVSDFIDNN